MNTETRPTAESTGEHSSTTRREAAGQVEPLEITTEVTLNGEGLVRVYVSFLPGGLSESDPRPEFNLQAQWPGIRRKARNAAVKFLAEREQKTTETFIQAKQRVRKTMGNLEVIKQNITSTNVWLGVTLGE